MWLVTRGICLLILAGFSIRDMQMRKIPAIGMIFAGIITFIDFLVNKSDMLWLHIGGGAVGIVFLIISKVTDEGVGYGDSIGITILGFYLGVWNILTVLMASFFLLLCVSIPVLWHKKMSRKVALPFYPFLTIGYLYLILTGG